MLDVIPEKFETEEIYLNLLKPDGIFKLNELIDFGSYGQVYHAEHIRTKSHVAVKVVSFYDHAYDGHLQEVKNIQRCDAHEHICKLFGTFGYKKNPDKMTQMWIVMELCDGGSLVNLIQAPDYLKKTLPNNVSRCIIKELLEAVKYLHSKSIIHRDLKSPNILFDKNGILKLIDFGSSINNPRNHKLNDVVGTLNWMAPEMIMCQYNEFGSYNYKVDIWSIGIVILEIIIGQNRIMNENMVDMIKYYGDLRKEYLMSLNNVSKSIKKLACNILILSPEKRPPAEILLKERIFIKYSREYTRARKTIANVLLKR